MLLFSLTEGLLDEVELKFIGKAEEMIRQIPRELSKAVYHRLFEEFAWEDSDKQMILDRARQKISRMGETLQETAAEEIDTEESASPEDHP